MENDRSNRRLFSGSDCLTREALQKYASGDLNRADKVLVEQHLRECTLCSDAVKGISWLKDHSLNEERQAITGQVVSGREGQRFSARFHETVDDLNRNMARKFLQGQRNDRRKGPFRIHPQIYYYAVAATVVIFIGIFAYNTFLPDKRSFPLTGEPEQQETSKAMPPEVEENSPETALLNKNRSQEKDTDEKDTRRVTDVITGLVPDGVERQPETVEIAATPDPDRSRNEPDSGILSAAPVRVETGAGREVAMNEELSEDLPPGDSALVMEYNPEQPAMQHQREDNSISGVALMEKAMQGKTESFDKKHAKEGGSEDLYEEEPVVFTVVEIMPEFPGGDSALTRYLSENVRYSANTLEAGREGKVYITFVIDRQGAVRDAKVLRGISRELDEEALRVIRTMPAWKPGSQRGKPVNVQYNFSVTFKLPPK